MSKSKGVKFKNLEEQINPLADEEGEEYEDIVVKANKKTKKKDKAVAKAKQLPKPTKEGVKKRGKRVGEAVVDNLTPDNLVEVVDEGVFKGIGNIATDVFMGKKLIQEKNIKHLDLSHLSNGIYNLTIIHKDVRYSKKVIKQ